MRPPTEEPFKVDPLRTDLKDRPRTLTLQKPLQREQLGNLRPAHLLRRMRQFAEGETPGGSLTILKPLFLRKLLTTVTTDAYNSR